jgi:hypothetical protein
LRRRAPAAADVAVSAAKLFESRAMRKPNQTVSISRREVLSAAAVPLAAALAPSVLSAQPRKSAKLGKIQVGIIGAGGIVSSVHVPGLRKMPNVEIVAVANRSLDSS